MLVLVSGSALAVGWADEHVGAIMQAWYPGEEAGTALADVLFGGYSPAGRLPITFPRSLDDVPDFTSYAMKGRTYRYLEKEPLYPVRLRPFVHALRVLGRDGFEGATRARTTSSKSRPP